MRKRAAIIGAGLAGLSSAILLAAGDIKVDVYEKNSRGGGKMNEFIHDGYRWDTGPSLLTMPFVLNMLLREAGLLPDALKLKIEKLSILCRYHFDDKSILDMSSDEYEMADRLERFSEGSGQEYRNFMKYVRHIYKYAAPLFLFTPFQEKKHLFKTGNLPYLFHLSKIDPFRSMAKAIRSYFSDDRLIKLFCRYATYNGSNPFLAPATLNIIAHVENEMGGYYVRGGMYRLVEQLVELAQSLGVRFHFSSEVNRIEEESGKIKGVVVNGSSRAADIIVSNMDFMETHRHLLGRVPSKYKKMESSLSGMVFLWGTTRTFSHLKHHNIFFPEGYKKEFDDIFTRKQAPEDPTVYVAVTSKKDRSHAPAGHENWFVLVNMPHLEEGQPWDEWVGQTRDAVFSRLNKFWSPVQFCIEYEKVLTPRHFFEKYYAHEGSIYGFSSNHPRSAFLRPPNRSREYKNLYFAGGSVHPGGGIPLTILSGIMASRLIIENEKEGRVLA